MIWCVRLELPDVCGPYDLRFAELEGSIHVYAGPVSPANSLQLISCQVIIVHNTGLLSFSSAV